MVFGWILFCLRQVFKMKYPSVTCPSSTCEGRLKSEAVCGWCSMLISLSPPLFTLSAQCHFLREAFPVPPDQMSHPISHSSLYFLFHSARSGCCEIPIWVIVYLMPLFSMDHMLRGGGKIMCCLWPYPQSLPWCLAQSGGRFVEWIHHKGTIRKTVDLI